MSVFSFRLRGSNSLSDAVVESLGELEGRVIELVRNSGETNVAGVCSALGEDYAYTTVMTTMDRLYKKGLLERRKSGRAFYYQAKHTREELEQGVAVDVIGKLFKSANGSVGPMLACIVDSVSERDLQLLDELERLVKEKREHIGSLK